METSDSLVCLLGDIGVFSFREGMIRFPDRILNFGIMEQSMVSFAAGLAKSGMTPVIHSIAPFIVERALEQIKIDFGYQKLGGNIVTVGSSFDYAALGATHHAPGDIQALLTIPGIQILVPGHASELRQQIEANYFNGRLSYFRLAEFPNPEAHLSGVNGIVEVRQGSLATVFVFGPLLEHALKATSSIDVQVIYITEISEESIQLAVECSASNDFIIVEPFYEGSTAHLFLKYSRVASRFKFIGVPREFLHRYGTYPEHLAETGLDSTALSRQVRGFLDVR